MSRYDGMGYEYADEDYENSDDGYDALKDEWVLGDAPMTRSQRREQESWDETCRQNRW
jgi:hypothetical protein